MAKAKCGGGPGYGSVEWHRRQVIEAARALFDSGLVIEDMLDLIIEAARIEFGVRVVVRSPAQFLVDGGEFVWPEGDVGQNGPPPSNSSFEP